MKLLMGMAQAIFGLIWFSLIGIYIIIWIGIFVINNAIDYFKKVNNEINIKRENKNE